jgi:tRNA U34 5-methylaminomethyl-2-thiouridine-forming methyltransferase MnmC
MNFDELDQLKSKNEKRIREIEEKYFESKNGIKTYKEVMTEMKESWETKE